MENSSDRVKLGEKISYFAVNIGNIPIMTLIGSFLLIFYTDVVGLDPAAVGTMFLVTRIVDGVNDPFMGYVIDHLPPRKWGRFRPYIALGSIICGLNFLLLWLGPSIAPTGKLLIAYICYVAIGVTFDIMDIPLNSLIPVMATKERDRTTLSIIKSLGYGAGGVLFTLPIVPFVGSFPTMREGYHLLIIIAVAFVIVLSIIGTMGVKERVAPASKERYNAKDLARIFTLLPVIGLSLSSIIGSIAGNAVGSSAIYYFKYVAGDENLMTLFSFLTLVLGGAGIIPAIFLVKRMGHKEVWMTGMIMSLVPSVLALCIPRNQPLLLLLVVGIGRLGAGFAGIVNYALQADLMDYVEWKQGHRTEGAIAAIFSFISKAGGGIGGAIPGYVLAVTGYIPLLQPQQPSAISGMVFLFLWLPVIATILSLLCMLFLYPITGKVSKEMQSDLLNRRELKDGD